MSVNLKVLAGVGLLAVAPASFAQNYSMDLTGVGNGTVADGVYVSPYVATISGPGMSYTGFVICDDFNSEAYLNTPWIATMSSAGALNGTQKFGAAPGSKISFNGSTYTIQQAYNAAGWLANGLMANANTNLQTSYAFAIWDIFDGQSTDPNGNGLSTDPTGAVGLEAAAFAAASSSTNPYVASDVSVFTPSAANSNPELRDTQEFLVVHAAPEVDPTAAASGISLLLGGVLVLRGRRKLGA
jgi:hypothetical protein